MWLAIFWGTIETAWNIFQVVTAVVAAILVIMAPVYLADFLWKKYSKHLPIR